MTRIIKMMIPFLWILAFFQCKKEQGYDPGYPDIPDVVYSVADEFDTSDVVLGDMESAAMRELGFSLKYHLIPNGFELVCFNNNPFVTTIAIDDSVTNCRSDKEMPYPAVLNANKACLICTYSAIDTTRPPVFNSAIFGFIEGIIGSAHNDDYIYDLPYANGESHILGQGYNSDFTHIGNDGGYCLDFLMPAGTRICAAREGIVCGVEDEHDTCGIDEYFDTLNNYIIILHDDLTSAVYSHLRYGGACVQTGDHVEKGQFIGYSGMVGYTNIPHLHFEVDVPVSPLPARKIAVPTRFNAEEGNKIFLEEGHGYRSIALTGR
jgi:hypothetical protein